MDDVVRWSLSPCARLSQPQQQRVTVRAHNEHAPRLLRCHRVRRRRWAWRLRRVWRRWRPRWWRWPRRRDSTAGDARSRGTAAGGELERVAGRRLGIQTKGDRSGRDSCGCSMVDFTHRHRRWEGQRDQRPTHPPRQLDGARDAAFHGLQHLHVGARTHRATHERWPHGRRLLRRACVYSQLAYAALAAAAL